MRPHGSSPHGPAVRPPFTVEKLLFLHLSAPLGPGVTTDTSTRGQPLGSCRGAADVLKLGGIYASNSPTAAFRTPAGISSPQPLAQVTLPPRFRLDLAGRFQRTVAFGAPTNAANVSGHRAAARRRRRALAVRRREARTCPRCPPPTSGGLVGDGVPHAGRIKHGRNGS